MRSFLPALLLLGAFGAVSPMNAQESVSATTSPQAETSPQQAAEKAMPAVAMVLAADSASPLPNTVGTALAVRQDGVLLTAYHVVRNAYALQIRLKSGEVFDQVQLLGVDARRDVAAIRISASGLPTLPVAPAALAKPGDPVIAVAHPEALPWSTSNGVVAAYRMADEVPGAGSGYRLIQFTAASSAGSSGGVLIDGQGRALGLIVGSLNAGQNLNFAVPIESVMGLAEGAVSKSFGNGSALKLPNPVASPAVPQQRETGGAVKAGITDQPEKSDALKNSRDREYILRNFKTLYINCSNAKFFGSDEMKAALVRNEKFAALNITIVNDPDLADTVMTVGYTFAWEYPFELVHQNTSTLLVAGKGTGPFSGPLGAARVAQKFVDLLRPYRSAPPVKN